MGIASWSSDVVVYGVLLDGCVDIAYGRNVKAGDLELFLGVLLFLASWLLGIRVAVK